MDKHGLRAATEEQVADGVCCSGCAYSHKLSSGQIRCMVDLPATGVFTVVGDAIKDYERCPDQLCDRWMGRA